jgi:uncharacterized alkaline shock family protein YloU
MEEELYGNITIAPAVLNTIARLTTLGVPGVARMGSSVQLLQAAPGTTIKVVNGKVKADVYVILQADCNFYATGQQIQHEVSRAISEIVGMDVQAINVHVQDVEYSQPDAPAPMS